jgi:hypothetical protein
MASAPDSYSIVWKYGENERDDCIEIAKRNHHHHKDKGKGQEDQCDDNETRIERQPQPQPQPQQPDETSAIQTVQLKRWTTFKSCHFPDGAIVTGFRGRRDYKDGKCQGIMCCAWCSKTNQFSPCIFTISNGYNGKYSINDFNTIELCDEKEFTSKTPINVMKRIKKELK